MKASTKGQNILSSHHVPGCVPGTEGSDTIKWEGSCWYYKGLSREGDYFYGGKRRQSHLSRILKDA